MNIGIRFVIALIASVLVGAVGYIKSRYPSRKERFLEKASAQGYCGMANLIKKSTGYRGSDGHEYPVDYCTYEYVVNGVSYQKKTTSRQYGFEGNYPKTIVVYYNPNNPKKSICPSEIPSRNSNRIAIIVSAVLTFLFVIKLLDLLQK